MKTKIIALLMVLTIAFSCFACANKNGSSVTVNKESVTSESAGEDGNRNQLEIIKSNETIAIEDRLSKIKAEYLLSQGGYKDDDQVVAIVTLPEASVIQSYNASNSTKSVKEYLNSTLGKAQVRNLTASQSKLVERLKKEGLIEGVEANYTTVLNGVAVRTAYGNIAKLESRKDIGYVMLSDTFNRPMAVEASAIENIVDIYETGIFKPTGVSYTGVGTSVAVLDSGFDCSHSVFNSHSIESSTMMFRQTDILKILGNTNAAKTSRDIELEDVWYSNKIPFVYDYADKDADVFPYDSEHGTHVAGIIGGQDDVIQGIAPDAQLVLMKVFPDLDTGADTEDILLALEDAVTLGVDAINMSLGSSCGFAREADNDHLNEVYDSIYDTGISLITAASNDYSAGYGGAEGNTNKVTNPDSGTVGSPSSYEAALSVASISGTKSNYLIANGSKVVFFNESNSITGDPNDFFKELYEDLEKGETDVLEMEYVTIPGVGKKGNYSAYPEGYLNGKIALVRRGDNTFEDKALQAKNAGAAACIIYNNIEGDILMSMGKTDHIPTISISKTDGEILAEQTEGTIKISLSQKAGPFMSDFSSWGPTPSLGLKPEITAHGGNIISSVPGGGYDEQSGTSMACPNLCGVVILVRQYLKDNFDLTQKEMTIMANQLLMSTATIVLNQQGNPYFPRKQGAGLASLFNAVNTRAYLTVDGIDKTKLELKDDPEREGVYEMTFNVKNISQSPITYDLSVIAMTESVSTSDKDFVAERSYMLGGNSTYEVGEGASISGSEITVDANSTAKVTVTYALSNEDKNYIEESFAYGMYVEGFVKLTAKGEEDVDLNIPFLAFYGDWSEAPMFDKTFYEVESEAHNAAIDEEDKLKADYLATTPYGSYYYNYIIPLGAYLYDVDTNLYDPIPASEDKIAISDYLGSIDGIYSVYTGLLRSAKTMVYTITDKVTGETVWTHTDYNARKAYYYGTQYPYLDDLKFKSAYNNLTNNRVYEFTMEGKLDYENDGSVTNKRNSFSFDFTLDNEAPIIKEVTYEKEYDRTLKEDRYYINVTVYDNHYTQSLYPIAFTSSSSYTYLTDNPIPVYGEKNSNTTVRFEITDMLDDLGEDELITNALAFLVEDYALNSNLYLCQLPGTKGDFKFTTDGSYEGTEITTINAYVGDVINLTTFLASADETIEGGRDYLKYLNWTSSDEKKVEVAYGSAVCKAKGRVLITVTEQMDGKKAICTVNVKDRKDTDEDVDGFIGSTDDAQMTEIRFTYFETLFAYSRAAQTSEIGETGSRIYLNAQPTVSFYPGEQIKLFYQINPWYAEGNYQLEYKSSNPKIADVDQNGKVIAKQEGSTRITLTVGGSNLIASLRVVVKSEFVIENRQLIAYKGLGGKVEIPDDEGILYIAAYAFCLYDTDTTMELPEDDYDANKIPATNTTVTEVVVPHGVEYIEKYAFYNCTGLKKVTLPDTVRFIRNFAFYNDAKLESINLGEVEAIGAKAFEGCASLKEIDLSSAYSLGEKAFKGCTTIKFVDLTALRNAGNTVFSGCTSLESAVLGENTKLSEAMFVQTGLKEVDIYETETIPAFCFAECESLVTVNIKNDLVSIGYGAFCETPALKTVTTKKVERIENQAFYDSGLEEFTLPSCEVTLGEYSFLDCDLLERVVFGKDTKILSLVGPVFKNTAVTSFEVNAENPYYQSAGSLLLSHDGETLIFASPAVDYGDFVLANSIKKIGDSAFAGAKINSVTIANSDVVIGAYAFADSNITSVILPTQKGVVIGDHAFNLCKDLQAVENLGYAQEIGAYAFSSTAVKNVVIGEGVTVKEGAFYLATTEKVTLGANSSLGDGAFRQCSYLKEVVMPTAGGVTFGSLCFAQDISLEIIDLSNYEGEIKDQTFYACTALKAVSLNKVTKIGSYAFADCSTLNYVSLPIVESIGEGAFSNNNTDYSAPTFSSISLPETLTYLGDGVFMGCAGLAEITIPNSLTEIPDYTFTYCLNLSTVTLGDNVTKIGDYAFGACKALTQINTQKVEYFGENSFIAGSADPTPLTFADLSSAVYIGGGAFAGTFLTGDFDAPNLQYIGAYAFQYADVINFSAPNVAYILEGAFDGNANLTSFAISENLCYLESMAFIGCTSITDFTDLNGEKDTVINDYVRLVDGVIYTTMKSGKYLLSAVPAGKNVPTLEIIEGTQRIDLYAGNENKTILKIVMPDSLKLIGNYAFYGCDGLAEVEFRSVTAPYMESFYNSSIDVVETDPGYAVLHPVFDLFGYELCYVNFKDVLGKVTIPSGQKAPIKMILPSNEDIEGYDGLVYEGYFGKVEDARRSDYEAMEKSMILFLERAEEVAKIVEVTISHEKLINDAVSQLNAVTQNPTDYGVDADTWNNYVQAVTEAKDRLFEIKLSSASKAVQQLQADINAFDKSVNIANVSEFISLKTRIEALLPQDRAVLNLTEYYELLTQYNLYCQQIETEVAPLAKEVVDSVAGVTVPLVATGAVGLGAVLFAIIKKRWFI